MIVVSVENTDAVETRVELKVRDFRYLLALVGRRVQSKRVGGRGLFLMAPLCNCCFMLLNFGGLLCLLRL